MVADFIVCFYFAVNPTLPLAGEQQVSRLFQMLHDSPDRRSGMSWLKNLACLKGQSHELEMGLFDSWRWDSLMGGDSMV